VLLGDLIPLSHLRTDVADRSAEITEEISRRDHGDSTKFCLNLSELAETVHRGHGASTDAVANGQRGQNFPRIVADSEGCSTVRVRTSPTRYTGHLRVRTSIHPGNMETA